MMEMHPARSSENMVNLNGLNHVEKPSVRELQHGNMEGREWWDRDQGVVVEGEGCGRRRGTFSGRRYLDEEWLVARMFAK